MTEKYVVTYKGKQKEFTDWDKAYGYWMSFKTDATLEIVPDGHTPGDDCKKCATPAAAREDG